MFFLHCISEMCTWLCTSVCVEMSVRCGGEEVVMVVLGFRELRKGGRLWLNGFQFLLFDQGWWRITSRGLACEADPETKPRESTAKHWEEERDEEDEGWEGGRVKDRWREEKEFVRRGTGGWRQTSDSITWDRRATVYTRKQNESQLKI